MNLSGIRLVTFDVTGTILKFKQPIGEIYSAAAKKYGVEISKDEVKKNFKKQWKIMTKKHPIFGREDIGWEQWWKNVVRGTFNDATIKPEKLECISNNLINCFKGTDCWSPVDGSREILSFLNKSNIKVGVISNTDDRLETVLKSTELSKYFCFVLTSYAAGFEKPDVRIFEKAVEISGLCNLKGCDCLHIGDTIETDYVGAKNARWNSFIINSNFNDINKKYPHIKKNEVFKNLNSVYEYMLSLK